MFNLDTRIMMNQIHHLLTYDDISTTDIYNNTITECFKSITYNGDREKMLLETTIMAIDDTLSNVITNIEENRVIESYSKYIDYSISDKNNENKVLEFFDYIIGDYINNTIMSKTQKVNNHIDALMFKGLNYNDVNDNGLSVIHESDMYDFINILNECNLLSDEFLDYYTDNVTECFITTSDECMRIISGKGDNTDESESTPINSSVIENLAFPNSDFISPTIESLTRLQDVEEISSDGINDVKNLIKDIYDCDETFGGVNGTIGDLYHKYFACIVSILDNDNCNVQQIKWACVTIGQAVEKFYNKIKNNFSNKMVEIFYLTLIVKRVQISEKNEPINDIMYYIHRMRHILFDNSFDENTNKSSSCNYDSQTGDTSSNIMESIEDFLSVINLVSSTLKTGGKLDAVVSEMSSNDSNRLDDLTITTESDIHNFHRSDRSVSSKDLINVLTESFEILSDGSIKVRLPKKTTYMEEYASNHRLLKENQKVNDYEAMRYNLVYNILLAESIENKIMHNKKIDENSELYTEAVKARSFALNDITTYLPEVKKNLPDFDLNEFYSSIKAEKQTVKIDTIGTISGIKKIINYILLH